MRFVRRALCATVFALATSAVQAAPFSNLFVFGDSLSDSGNVALSLPGREALPIPGNAYIPSLPYSPSGTFSNGPTWVTQFGAALGFTMRPAFSPLGGTNFAIGGATTGTGPTSMVNQVGGLVGLPGGLPSDALYVIAGGGNNARAALQVIAGGSIDPQSAITAAGLAYANDIVAMITALASQGAEEFIVWNVPNLGIAPAITAGGPVAIGLGTLTASVMNEFLVNALALLPAGIRSDVQLFDLFGLVTAAANDPPGFGFADVTQACAANPATCTDPDTWLFWDGIHPTSGGHALIADRMLALVPIPATLPLLVVGVLGLLALRRRAV